MLVAGRIETRNLSYQNIFSNEICGLDTVSGFDTLRYSTLDLLDHQMKISRSQSNGKK